jgi:RHS repeat-associated protein
MVLDVIAGVGREFVYRAGSFVPLAMLIAASKPILRFVTEPNGCPTRLISIHGEVNWEASYLSWAQISQLKSNEIDNPLRLQGQYFDGETGFCQNRYRYFDPIIGSFVSVDPLGIAPDDHVLSLAPNENSWIDPLGLAKCKTHGHHAWPKYLGGAKKQKLVPLSVAMHKKYHKGLDTLLPRWKGKKYYDSLSPKAKKQALADLRDYTKAFDKKYNTKLFSSMRSNGFPLK